MGKSSFFTGQPVFAQILSYVSSSRINRIAAEYQADYYYKELKTYQHLVSLLYGIFNRCEALREVVTGLQAWEHKVLHLGMDYQPRRSTLSDANKKRTPEVFEAIYLDLYHRYRHLLPDSRTRKAPSNLYIVDSTTIGLFQEILRNAGRSPVNGKRKGGIKVHTMTLAKEDVPCLVRMTAAAAADGPFLKEINLPQGSILVMDRGYVNYYGELIRLDKQGVIWVSRLRANSVYKVVRRNNVSESHKSKGILSDQMIILGHTHNKKSKRVKARLVEYKDPETKQVFQFLTNGQKLTPTKVADYYKKRWQIELLYKRLKQNYPLKSFLGDNENAIKIQIWCALIADLLLKIIKAGLKRSTSFSQIASTVRILLMSYINLFSYLENPDKALIQRIKSSPQYSLFPT